MQVGHIRGFGFGVGTDRPASWTLSDVDAKEQVAAWAARTSARMIAWCASDSWQETDAIAGPVTFDDDENEMDVFRRFYDTCARLIEQGQWIGESQAETRDHLDAWARRVGVLEASASRKKQREPDRGPLSWELPKLDAPGFADKTMDVTRLLCGGFSKGK
jgi:hypothetical protein